MEADKRRPAPLLVCTYSFGESEAARSPEHAATIAHEGAAAACRPIVRVNCL